VVRRDAPPPLQKMNRGFAPGAAALVLLGCGLVTHEPTTGSPDSAPAGISRPVNSSGSSALGSSAFVSTADGTDGASPDGTTADAILTNTGSLDGTGADATGSGAEDVDAGSTDGTSEDVANENTAVCGPAATQCSGSSVQTCGLNGQWESAVACPNDAPFCNALGLCNICQNGTTRCLFNGVQTCTAGTWGDTVACPASTPNCAAGVCGQPPSCQVSAAGTSTCGPGGSGTESCCASPEVPGGTYYRTYDPITEDAGREHVTLAADGGPTAEADPATLGGFRLDKYLVTVGRFRQYVNYVTGSAGAPPANGSGIHTHLNGGLGLANSGAPGTYEPGWDATDWSAEIATGAGAISTWDTNLGSADSCVSPASPPAADTWTNAPSIGILENLPINCVNWYEAYAFCIWDGGFLPSEAEWEYAAAGGSQQLEYPWGAGDAGAGSLYAIYDDYYTSNDSTHIAPVGSALLGAGYWGQLDLAGEVDEWTLDWRAPYVDPCINCAYLTPSSSRAIRGGEFSGGVVSLVAPGRYGFDPTFREVYLGFRCARSAP